MQGPRSSITVSLLEIIRFMFLGRYLQVSNSSFTIFHSLFFQISLQTSSLHSLNQSGMLLTSPYLGLDFYSQIQRKRAEKRTISVVVAVDLLHVSHFGKSIRLCSQARTVASAYSAAKSTQCRKCWRFDHSSPLCKEVAQVCPICTLLHHCSAHRCANQSSPKGCFD